MLYLRFLRSLLKDRPYVLMAYMTGILPIAKYSSGSELNMFLEYTMITEKRFSEDFGFTEAEVDEIFSRYQNLTDKKRVTRESLALMISGIRVPAKICEYAATSMKMRTSDEIFSAMVVYGFLSYESGKVCIPNKELMEKFTDMLQKEPSLGYVYQLAKESARMLQATLSGDTETMAQI